MTNIAIGTPHTREAYWEYLSSLFATNWRAGNFLLIHQGGFPVDVGRNLVVEKFLKHPAQPAYLIFADSDATWHPEAVARLVGRGRPVITGCIYRRKLPPAPTFGPYAGERDGQQVYNFGWSIERILDAAERFGLDLETPNNLLLPDWEGAVEEIGGCGMHFCCIRRDVLEAIPYGEWFKCVEPGAGEDFYFCGQARAAGFKIYADFSVHTGHMAGPGIDFGIRELMAFMKYTKAFDEVSTWLV